MRILTLAATPFFADRGCHIRIYNEAKYLQRLGADVFVLTYHNGRDVQEIKTKRIGNVRWYKKLSPGFHWGKPWLDLKLLFLTISEIKKYQPDVLHAHLYESLAVGYLAKVLTGSKANLILDLQGDMESEFESYNPKNSIAKKIAAEFSKWLIKRADKVVVSSQRALESARKNYKGPVEIIADGVDLQLYENNSMPMFREIADWKAGKKLLIYTGSVQESKGVGGLINEFISCSEQLPNWKLLVVGYGKNLERYEKLVADKKLQEKIKFTGPTNYFDLPKYLSMADLAIDPKTDSTESSGKIVNYMAAKLPIICYENEFNKNFLKQQGIYINSIKDLSKAMADFKRRNITRIDYPLSELDVKKEVDKLYSLFTC